jgi:hypothetical protein
MRGRFLPEGQARLSHSLRASNNYRFVVGHLGTRRMVDWFLPVPALRVKKPRAIVVTWFHKRLVANMLRVSRFTIHGGYDA